jgi:hypothetical protein
VGSARPDGWERFNLALGWFDPWQIGCPSTHPAHRPHGTTEVHLGEVRRIDMGIRENACQPGISAGEYRDGGIHWYQ